MILQAERQFDQALGRPCAEVPLRQPVLADVVPRIKEIVGRSDFDLPPRHCIRGNRCKPRGESERGLMTVASGVSCPTFRNDAAALSPAVSCRTIETRETLLMNAARECSAARA